MKSYEEIKKDTKIKAYIEGADRALEAVGYTEHSFPHVLLTAKRAKYLLSSLGFSEKEQELASIAAYLHDIGNLVNRAEHAQSGAVMAFSLLEDMGFSPEDTAEITSAIGNHDEGTGAPISPISAALILADKSDVRRSRVRNSDPAPFDIHDRVNFSANASELMIDKKEKTAKLCLTVDTKYCSIMDYFEIFLDRMILSRRAAEFLGLRFELFINDNRLL